MRPPATCIVLAAPAGSFEPAAIIKLLAYSTDFEVVLYTRMTRELIWTGANMGFFMKWANWGVAKYMEFLFNTVELTDVGCTMRLMSRKALERIQPAFSVGGSHFGPEMMLLWILSGTSLVQIPVNYRQRVGESMVCGNRWVAFRLGVRMALFITWTPACCSGLPCADRQARWPGHSLIRAQTTTLQPCLASCSTPTLAG